MTSLSTRCRLGIADSEFNRSELAANGYRPTAVAPILLDLESFDREVDEAELARLQRAKDDGGADWLFVGRVTPNKCQHDVVKAFAAHRRFHDPKARLHIVGGVASEPYAAALRAFVRKLGLNDCVSMTGPVSPGALAAHYRAADVYVCLSEHEGFCVPLLECMHFGVPIVAFGVTAVPETLADAGVCLPDKSPALVAAAVDRVLTDSRAPLAAARRGHTSPAGLHARAHPRPVPRGDGSGARREARVRDAAVRLRRLRRRRDGRADARRAPRGARRLVGRGAHHLRA